MINDKENFILDKRSGGFAIVSKTIEIVKNNIHQILILIAIMVAISMTQEVVDVYFIGENIFTEESTTSTFTDIESKQRSVTYMTKITKILSHDSTAAISAYVIFYIITGLLSYFASLAIFLVIDKKLRPIEAFVHILKKSIPIILTIILYILTLLLLCGIAFAIGMLIFYLASFTRGPALELLSITTIIIFGCYLFLRTIFYMQICILEEKYYFAAIKQSFKYTKKNVLAILWKIIEIILMLSLLFVLVLLPSHFIDSEVVMKIVEYILRNIIVTPIFTIYVYQLYKIYKTH